MGRTAHLEQQNLSATGREDVPDGLLFLADEAKAQANADPREWQRYAHGVAALNCRGLGARDALPRPAEVTELIRRG